MICELDLTGMLSINLLEKFPDEHRNNHYPHLRFVWHGKDCKAHCDNCGASSDAVKVYGYGVDFYDHSTFIIQHYKCQPNDQSL